MRLRLLLRKLTISAPQMRVLTHRPWYVKAMPFALTALISITLVVIWYEWRLHQGGKSRAELVQEVTTLRASVANYAREREEWRQLGDTAASQVQMEKTAREQLAQQMKSLEAENARLREDLSFFEKSIPATQGNMGLAMRSARLRQTAPGQYEFRALLAQNGKDAPTFVGRLELSIQGIQAGKAYQLTLPNPSLNTGGRSDASAYQLNFRHYQRLEGSFTLPTDVQIKSIQAKVFDSKTIRLTHNFNL